tara:strand:- start:2464 stop:3006 length:543 start_codon:yes stop_codon:yes gene_type:complete
MQEQVAAMLRESKFPNVIIQCPTCAGDGTGTYHNSETGETREGPCLTCNGLGKVESAEEYAIHDSEGLPGNYGEYCGLQAVADWVEFTERFDHMDPDDLAAIVEHFGDLDSATQSIDDCFSGIYDSFRDYADQTADDTLDMGSWPDVASRYFDYESYARDLEHDVTTVDVSGGRVAVFWA